MLSAKYYCLGMLVDAIRWRTKLSALGNKQIDLFELPQCVGVAASIQPLLRQINLRLSVMPDVARNKWNTNRPIEDTDRELSIITRLARNAEAFGVHQSWAEIFFRAQIVAAKQYQYKLFAQWERDKVDLFLNVPALNTVTRPYIDKITMQMLSDVLKAWPTLSDPATHRQIGSAIREFSLNSPYPEALSIATRPLIDMSSYEIIDTPKEVGLHRGHRDRLYVSPQDCIYAEGGNLATCTDVRLAVIRVDTDV